MEKNKGRGTFPGIFIHPFPLDVSTHSVVQKEAQGLIRALAETNIDQCEDAEDTKGWNISVPRRMAFFRRLFSCCLNKPRRRADPQS